MIGVQVLPLTQKEVREPPASTTVTRVQLTLPEESRQVAEVTEIATGEHQPDPSALLGDDMRGDMARSSAPGVARPSQPRTWALADGQEVMNLQFDLATQENLRAGLEVNKPMRVDGTAVGEVSIAINDNSRLYVSASDLRRVLPRELASRLTADADFVAFDALRESGIVIRYDPVADALNVTT